MVKIWLPRTGGARNVNFFVARGVDLGAAYDTWSYQANNLSEYFK